MPYFQKLFNNKNFYTTYVTEQGPLSLKISSYLDNICEGEEVKSTQKWLQIDSYWSY